MATDIGDRLRELRQHLGDGQRQFAKRFGRKWKAVSAWENKRQRPSPGTLTEAAYDNRWPESIFREGGPRPAEVVKRLQDTSSPSGGPGMSTDAETALKRALNASTAYLERIEAEFGDRIPVDEAEYAVELIAEAWKRWLREGPNGAAG